ncbi:response regulator (plasmid) [Tundrisphaera sp. TA3]|uniref:hybrid sensor histidine kinase/response regulator n=1 Tax=Tundrisphaera sp. TA3 TaxID=3435775 RepID=UPI003EBE206B
MKGPSDGRAIEARARTILGGQIRRINRWTDRFFAGLLIAQWAAAIGLVAWIAPLTWDGPESRIHPHVWLASGLGGLIVAPVVVLLRLRPEASAGYVVAVAQMLIGSLLIHLTGGRIETHFHVFGSLALLAFYRDWKILAIGSAVTVADHFLRGMFWPRSIFGLSAVDPARWIEHAGWIFFEDAFLAWSCLRSVDEMRQVARNQAALEDSGARVEAMIRARTADLERGEQRYRTLIEATSAIVWNTPASGEFVGPQPGWSEFTGQSFEELRGHGWLNAIHPDDREDTARTWSEAVARRSLYEIRHRLCRRDGEYRHMLGRAVPIADDTGEITEWLGIHCDVDDQARAIEAMAVARRAAESASRAKGEFLANMSHEIRTPMNGIINMTELALGTELSPQQSEYLKVVKGSSEALLGLINDILDFSKIEAGKLDLDPVPFRLRDCIDETMRVLAHRAHAKGLEITARVPPGVPDMVIGDAGRLRQVLVNLVGNAIKFTEQGEIAVSVEAIGCPTPGTAATLRVAVRDTGIGIPSEKLRTIFEPFEQADGSTTRKYGGTGLGLSISVKLVELMGGHLEVTSQPGRGSLFAFEVSFGLPPDPAGSARAVETLGGVPILVVDDNATCRANLVEILSSWGATPAEVDDGPAALERIAEARAKERPFRIVLIDAIMPGMSGYAVAEAVSSDPDTPGPCVIMMTTIDHVGDRSRCNPRGIAGRLTKPICQSELMDALNACLDAKGSRAPSSFPGDLSGEGSFSGRRYSILVAEDNLVNQKVMKGLLARNGHCVTIVGDGLQAMAALARERFDLVLMDIQMPEMDGFEAVAAIRESEIPGGRRQPIIALTAHAMKGDRERCLDSGFDGYVIKPVRSDLLFEAIDRLMAPSTAAIDPTPAPPHRPVTVYDRAAALERTGGDEALLREIIGLFIDDCPRLLEEIESAIESDNPARLRRAAHTLKGTAGHFGAEDIVDVAARLELAGHAPSCRSSAPEVASLLAALDRFYDALGDVAPPAAPWQLAPITEGVNSSRDDG